MMKINFEALFADRIYLMSCIVFTGLIYLHVLSDAIKSFYRKVFDQDFAISMPGNLILVTFSMIFASQIIKDYKEMKRHLLAK